MPYTVDKPPEQLKGLPKHLIEIWVAAFNSAFKQYDGNEGKAAGTAWAAVKTKYKKNKDGRWVLKEANVEMKEAMSDNDKRALLQSAVTDSLAIGNREHGPWIRDVYPDAVVYEIGGKNYRMAYVIDRKGKVVFGQPEKVVPETVYTVAQEAVESKIEELTTLTSEREDATEARESLNSLLELLERDDLSEAIAEPFIKKADEIIARLGEAAPMKTEDGQQYPRSAFAYTPEADKPSSWKLRLWEDTTKKITRVQLGRAAAALSPGGFRGNKVEIAKEALSAVKNRIRAECLKLGIDESDISKWVREEHEFRERVHESCEIDIVEVTKEGISNGIVPVRIIRPGFNSSKERFYSEQAIKDAAEIFEGAKMYADHPTKEDEKQSPVRSLRDWVSTLHNTRVSEEGNAVGDAHLNAGWLKEKIQTLFEQGDLQHLGVSINAVGKGIKQTIEGTKTVFVERLTKSVLQSVDFVTEAGAGGQAGLRESAIDNIVDAELIDLATLREARPDLIEAIESNIMEQIQTEVKAKMELDDKVRDLEGQVVTLTTERDTLKEAATQAERDRKKAEAQVTIKDAVGKAELPDVAKLRLLEAHKDAEDAEGIGEAIKSEEAYVASITGTGKIKGLGPSGEDKEKETKVKEALEAGFTELTGSEEAGKIAAKGR